MVSLSSSEDSAAAQVPWDTLSPLLEHLPNFPRAALMLRPDVWHNWHLGMGKAFLASAMVSWMFQLNSQ